MFPHEDNVDVIPDSTYCQDKKEKDHVGKPQQAAAKAENASAPPATASASAADNYEKHEQLVNSLLKTAITEGLKSLR